MACDFSSKYLLSELHLNSQWQWGCRQGLVRTGEHKNQPSSSKKTSRRPECSGRRFSMSLSSYFYSEESSSDIIPPIYQTIRCDIPKVLKLERTSWKRKKCNFFDDLSIPWTYLKQNRRRLWSKVPCYGMDYRHPDPSITRTSATPPIPLWYESFLPSSNSSRIFTNGVTEQEVQHRTPLNVRVKNQWSFTSTTPCNFMTYCFSIQATLSWNSVGYTFG